MGAKEFIQSLGRRKKINKELFRAMEDKVHMQQMIENKMKSANERELERFQDEEREEKIKEALEFYRRKRRDDIAFNHNPLNTPNITNHTDWEVLKEKNIFNKRSNMFSSPATVMTNNPSLLNNNRSLFGM